MGDHIIGRADALARGASDAELQRLCRSGDWIRLHPGSYIPAPALARLDTYEQHRLLVYAVAAKSAPDAVISHQSAAVLHGIDLWNTPLDTVHLTRDRTRGGRRSPHRIVHASALPDGQVTLIDSIRVTTVARTVVDLARSLQYEAALVAGDYALHTLPVTPDELDAVAESAPTHPGHCRARRVLSILDGRSESVGESRSRALFVREQLPIPALQANLYAATGTHLGRVDFLFEDLGVVGEFDGKVKYGRLVPDGQTPADVLWAEKVREDAIRATGWQVARWTWEDLRTPGTVSGRIRGAIERARQSPPPTGWVVHTSFPRLPHQISPE